MHISYCLRKVNFKIPYINAKKSSIISQGFILKFLFPMFESYAALCRACTKQMNEKVPVS